VSGVVLSETLRHVLSEMPLSCYQKSKRDYLAGIIGQSGAPNSSNPDKKSSGFLITATESVDNRLGRGTLSRQNSPRKSARNSVSLDPCDDVHETKHYSLVRSSLTGTAETPWTPLRCERGLGSARPRLIVFLLIANVPSEVRCCSRFEDSRRGEDVCSGWNARVTRFGALPSPAAMRVGGILRPGREGRQGAEARRGTASLERVICGGSQFPPTEKARAALWRVL
jgi:hypothetical protein